MFIMNGRDNNEKLYEPWKSMSALQCDHLEVLTLLPPGRIVFWPEGMVGIG